MNHPDQEDGERHVIPDGMAPLVRIGEIYGRAIEHTHTDVLVEWVDEVDGYQCKWFPAAESKIVKRECWHGLESL
ncbi:hypothetical protein J2S89_004102 [Arthrobacter bambusae]|nr:hypothetical protein [Arthrobacter bambusae]MDQ0100370.1 hypothetical protein [Arthrobacter bambusae]